MTRINVVDPTLLTDQHLLAEYRELPRVFALARPLKPREVVPEYRLGAGHVRFFYSLTGWLAARQAAIIAECCDRQFQIQHTRPPDPVPGLDGDWSPPPAAYAASLGRLRAKLHAAILLDLAADGSARDASLRELVAFKDKAAREAILKAIELERLLPAVYSGRWTGTGYFPARLIRAGLDLEEKRAVDAAVAYCRDQAKSALERARTPGNRSGYRFWGGDNRHILRKLAAWSGDEALLKYTEGGRGGHEIRTVEAAEAFGAEVEKAAAWWKANREAFKFPAPPPPPPADAPAPADGPKPADPPKDPEMF